MPVEIIKVYLEVSEDSTFAYETNVKIANGLVDKMEAELNNSPMLKLDPDDGRKAIYTLRADIEKGLDISVRYELPS